jgi:hypothetical protein
MELVVTLCLGVLHGYLLSELDVGVDRLPELLIVGKVRPIYHCHIELDKPLPLLLGDLEVPVAMRRVKPSSRLKRSGPPKDSAVRPCAPRWEFWSGPSEPACDTRLVPLVRLRRTCLQSRGRRARRPLT